MKLLQQAHTRPWRVTDNRHRYWIRDAYAPRRSRCLATFSRLLNDDAQCAVRFLLSLFRNGCCSLISQAPRLRNPDCPDFPRNISITFYSQLTLLSATTIRPSTLSFISFIFCFSTQCSVPRLVPFCARRYRVLRRPADFSALHPQRKRGGAGKVSR